MPTSRVQHPRAAQADDEWNRRLALVGARIRVLRRYKGLTQTQLAQLIGLGSRKPIARWESGEVEPPLWAMFSLSCVFSRQVIDIAAPLESYVRELWHAEAPTTLYEYNPHPAPSAEAVATRAEPRP